MTASTLPTPASSTLRYVVLDAAKNPKSTWRDHREAGRVAAALALATGQPALIEATDMIDGQPAVVAWEVVRPR